MAAEPELRAHQEWIGFVQPVGLVVSPAALLATQTYVQRNIIPQQQILQGLVHEEKIAIGPEGEKEARPVLPDLREFCIQFLGWRNTDIIGVEGAAQIPDTLKVALADYGETLAPTYAVPDPDQNDGWVLLIQTLKRGTDLDSATKQDDRHWHATPQARFERLLRETKVPIGLLFNHTEIRLVYTPSGESTGYLTFPIKAMCEVAGRPIAAALHMLLSAERLFTVETARRLPAILRESRKYQNEVSTALAEQVLAALNELLRGFQAANEASKNVLLGEVLASDPSHVYGGLLTSLMRLVFILYAEDRGLLPSESVYVNSYSVEGLFERLREDAARYPDNMDGRYGAWAQLLTLFRLIYDGANHSAMRLPARHGKLFDPDAYPFLEGRHYRSQRVLGERLKLPRLSDGVIHRVLTNLLLLDGEQLSYRALDVEQIGSVYEAMMGYEIQIAKGPSVGFRPDNVVVNLQEVLDTVGDNRQKLLRDVAGCEVTGQALEQVKSAKKIEELLSALAKKISGRTPYIVAIGAMYLQPTDERRRSGSHYTPRSLTEPIVSMTLQHILERLGDKPRPEQILDLKVCDPAMGSGAFLVEACRFLGDKLVESWLHFREQPAIPADEEPSLYARRLIAQRCLYGLDKNPFAVDLAKLSLWLATLAKDHPFTFLDHALRCGDSLVGLTRKQIANFHWDSGDKHTRLLGQEQLERTVEKVGKYRKDILLMTEDNEASILLKHEKLAAADQALTPVRRAGDLVLAAFFHGSSEKERESLRKEYFDIFVSASRGYSAEMERERQLSESIRREEHPLLPFHWELEFPEVFERENSGFDAIVGNPPFMGAMHVSNVLGMPMFGYLTQAYPGARHLCDLVAYFFRRAFQMIRSGGTFGLIATKSIAQGDTRSGGLSWICNNGGTIYSAHRRQRWPGKAAVVVSVIHIVKNGVPGKAFLDGRLVPKITAYLFTRGGHDDPARLGGVNCEFSQGVNIRSKGFLIEKEEEALNAEISELLRRSPKNKTRVLPYVGGEEINNHPNHEPNRFVVYLSDIREESGLDAWPELTEIVRRRVKPERDALGSNPNNIPLKKRWWAYHADRRDFYSKARKAGRLLVIARHTARLAFVFQTPDRILAESLNLFLVSSYAGFAALQSRIHETWARFFASSLGDTMRYSPSDCFETFPFPREFEVSPDSERIGRTYYEFRSSVMIRNNEGLTATYNRFNDRDETSPDIVRLRELHAMMDRAVLDAYGWTDVTPAFEFSLEYEEDEDLSSGPRRRKEPWRYGWPDGIRDDILARLLELNRVRAEEEQLSGAAAEAKSKASAAGKQRRNKRDKVTGMRSLLADVTEEGKS